MGLLAIPSLLQLLYLSLAGLCVYRLYWELTIGRHRRNVIKKHACKPVPRVKSIDWILGIDTYFKTSRWSKQYTLLENMDRLLFSLGHNTVAYN